MFAKSAFFALLACLPQQAPIPVGTKLPPYSFLLSWGEQRGRSHCYVCESLEKPVVIFFAPAKDPKANEKWVSAEVTQLTKFLDGELAKRPTLAAWMTFGHTKQEELDGPIVRWGETTGLRKLPVGTYEDPLGPPAFRLGGKAILYAVIAKEGKVEKVFSLDAAEGVAAFQTILNGELDRIAPIPKAEPKPVTVPEIKPGSAPAKK